MRRPPLEHPPSDDSVGAIRGFFDDEERAVEEFFDPKRPPTVRRGARGASSTKPTHYKVMSISMYTEDIERLNEMVREAKALGHTRANKSMLIREALRQLDLSALRPQA